ncbi:conserved hypothetical protein [Aeropyrum pernix K1]|uniref:Putative type II restriction enzyme ApeKORF2002P n=1 Tax=Aeropyrum pernix (strain ATCC 700893 / DSM 11879 / JCM 9820 / NBRC 100138 / K1) TaxID=272557 RepID=T2M2_AERPE|nr:RecName: Full=Putative type II restriction enzyme ApeKORF2002P; Short=ApeKORF2002P [Aeropyrum pernix K1]BAA81011.2 conserved hypothetical protein [Aeropyrum pernix K1]
MPVEVIPVLHNVSSVQRVVDMARLSYSLGLDTLVVTKAYGGAAQSGVPEAMRLALKLGKSLVVLPELRDAVNLLSPTHVLAVTPSRAERLVGPGGLEGLEGRVLVVFSGGEPELDPSEAAGAIRVYIEGVEGKVGPIAEAALILYFLLRGGGDGRG